MKKEWVWIYRQLHDSADRLALEASRQRPIGSGDEADRYIKAYKKVLDFLLSEYDKNIDAIRGQVKI